jgi:hypothetical protein
MGMEQRSLRQKQKMEDGEQEIRVKNVAAQQRH